ncbi:hypothetical protein DNHGIG_40760 [Collibacillus ludicampi]|uniref:Uncharacterized protein n=1 Tax=Collibacillus ludicampi TaxID=2771369 RepID=A0AAV4LL79_9BACL|nr:hypothetical protein [Collibacillus ludicampi]GIM48527.1 hypothetical protein DNHGIG_40760 [Collibacillus ludicampi]
MNAHTKDIQDEIAKAQHHLHIVEAMIHQASLEGIEYEALGNEIDHVQAQLVGVQLKLYDMQEKDMQEAPFRHGAHPYDCEVKWNPSERILKISIPDTWERVHTRPSIYIKDILRFRNATRVKVFYTKLFQRLLTRERERGNLNDFKPFAFCYAGFLFHFSDRHMRDPDNQMVKVLVDAAKISGVFQNDSYQNFMYAVGGVHNPNWSGLELYFSDSHRMMETFFVGVHSYHFG